jgi:hypothetical protein
VAPPFEKPTHGARVVVMIAVGVFVFVLLVAWARRFPGWLDLVVAFCVAMTVGSFITEGLAVS